MTDPALPKTPEESTIFNIRGLRTSIVMDNGNAQGIHLRGDFRLGFGEGDSLAIELLNRFIDEWKESPMYFCVPLESATMIIESTSFESIQALLAPDEDVLGLKESGWNTLEPALDMAVRMLRWMFGQIGYDPATATSNDDTAWRAARATVVRYMHSVLFFNQLAVRFAIGGTNLHFYPNPDKPPEES